MVVLIRVSLLVVAVLAVSGCRWLGYEVAETLPDTSGRFPDVLDVEL